MLNQQMLLFLQQICQLRMLRRFDNLKKVKIGISPAIKQADAIVEKMIKMLQA